HLPVAISGDTRESFTVDEQASGLQYRFVLPGPRLSEQERLGCLAALRGLHPAPAYLVVSGSFTPGIEPSFFDELLALAGQVGARLVVDLSGEPLAYAARRGGAYLIKPSLSELASLIGRMPESEREQEGALRELIAAGAAEVIVLSLGAAGALYASGDRLERISAPSVPMVSAVGAGDSMLGAVVLALAQGRELGDAVRYGVAAGAATVMRPGTQLCLREDVERLFRGG
ncbi:MAG: 1-phosphofructokinase family hexose kinase, partial [Stutzerimonas sp.]|uniref:1-phosphofructokinase family hexose kinase n=1 Tax=Stutzerimonas sp. TaxID=2901166 RepID=UPI003D0A2DFD